MSFSKLNLSNKKLELSKNITEDVRKAKMNSCNPLGLRSSDIRGVETVLEYCKNSIPAQKLSLYLQQMEGALTIVVLRIVYEVRKGISWKWLPISACCRQVWWGVVLGWQNDEVKLMA